MVGAGMGVGALRGAPFRPVAARFPLQRAFARPIRRLKQGLNGNVILCQSGGGFRAASCTRRRPLRRPAAAAADSAAALGAMEELSSSPTVAGAATRSDRLEALLLLRKLYRNLLRAEPLLQLPSPVYVAPEEPAAVLELDVVASVDLAAAATDADTELQRVIDEAVVVVAEMELTAEELRVGLRALKGAPLPFGSLFGAPTHPTAAEEAVRTQVAAVYEQLLARVTLEMETLPFSSLTAAQAAMDARNARYRGPGALAPLDSTGDSEGAPEGGYIGGAESRRGLGERLTEAERVAERFLAKRLQPAVARVRDTSPEGLIQGVQQSAYWARGLWDRLNGAAAGNGAGKAPAGLPLPATTEAERAAAVESLHGEIEELERKLQDASKARETRLRKAGIQGRARMAAELRQMDNEVAAVSRALAVRTLQLEMEFVYGCLESEAVDILGDPSSSTVALALARRGSTNEVALLAAEFRQLDGELATMAAEVESGGSLYLDDAELAALASEIPDLRVRLGVGDTTVFGGQKFSLNRLQMQLRQAIATVFEAGNFGTRGVRLMGSDLSAAGRLFWRALLGGTLKPREVAALRRTARDLLTFIPFAIILILPLTPVGHVLIFGFIQRYFPGFFPSQFTTRRQDLMVKYEELTKQLQKAQLAAEEESDEMAFQKAAAAAVADVQRRAAAANDAVSKAETRQKQEREQQAQQESSDEGDEGPAAAAVRKLQIELAAAADSSYTEIDED